MSTEWPVTWFGKRGLQLLLRLVSPCVAMLLLLLPLCLDTAHHDLALGQGLGVFAVSVPSQFPERELPADASSSGHCALHCVPQVVIPALLLAGMLAPLALTRRFAPAQLRSCAGLPPLLPPPQTR